MPRWQRNAEWGVVDRPKDGEHGGVLFAASLTEGLIHRVEGPAAVVARAALRGEGLTVIRRSCASELGVPEDDVDELALAELLEDLVTLGLLHKATG